MSDPGELEDLIRTRSGSARTEAQLDLAWAMVQTNPDRATAILDEAMSGELAGRLEARAHTCRATLCWVRAEFDAAREHAENALARMGVDEDHPWRSRALNSLGAVAFLLRDYVEARARYEAAAEIVERRGGEAAILFNNLGMIDNVTGRYREALPQFEKAYELACAAGNSIHQAHIQSNIANVRFNTGSFAKALKLYEAAVAIYEVHGAENIIGDMCIKIASVHAVLRQIPEALRYSHRAVDILERSDTPVHLAHAYTLLADLQLQMKDPDGAGDSYRQSLEIADETGYRGALPTALNGLAELRQRTGDLAGAKRYRQRSLDVARELGLHHTIAEILHGVGRDHMQERDLDAAESALASAVEILEEATARDSASWVHRTLCDLYLARGDHSRALEHLRLHGSLRSDIFAESEPAQPEA